MKVGIMQPYFMPYIGYFQLMKAVDKYVVYDDVNYIKGGWINRNNILINGEKKLFTITLKSASQNKLINEIEIGDNFNKLKKTLTLNYAKAPYFNNTMSLLERITNFEDKQLANFISNSFKEILTYLCMDTEIILSSNIKKNNLLKGQDKVIQICKTLNANEYINAIGGQELYDKKEFAQNGVNLKFLKMDEGIIYPQFSQEFVSGLSIIDVLMFNSIEETNEMLDKFILE